MTSLSDPFNRLQFNATLYDSITDAWKYIFGDNFHFGYFASANVSLDEATDALIEKMASLGNLNEETKILDVGCGIGNPAFFLNGKYGCAITGISTSQLGIQRADEAAQKRGVQDKVCFRVANGLDNGFSDNSFDIAWVMESSHLMKDKKKLLAECFRILKPGGALLLCDIMLQRPFGAIDLIGYLKRMKYRFVTDYYHFIRAFGLLRMETFDAYQRLAREVGFREVTFLDISEEVMLTQTRWKANAVANKAEILKTWTPQQLETFLIASDLSDDFYRRKIAGYGILHAKKS
jgi:27-O-demethylrifamycin SV methyltransferase